MFTEVIKPRFHETDAMGHINNAVMAEWFEGGRTSLFRSFAPEGREVAWKMILAKITIDYLRETHFGSDIEIRCTISHIGNSSFHIKQECWQDGQMTASGTAVIVRFDYEAKKSVKLDGLLLEKLQEHLVTTD